MTKKKKLGSLGSITVSRTESPNHTETSYRGWDMENGKHSVNADELRLRADYLMRMGLLRPEVKAIRITFLGEDE